VRHHVENIFAKLGIHSRRSISSRLAWPRDASLSPASRPGRLKANGTPKSALARVSGRSVCSASPCFFRPVLTRCRLREGCRHGV